MSEFNIDSEQRCMVLLFEHYPCIISFFKMLILQLKPYTVRSRENSKNDSPMKRDVIFEDNSSLFKEGIEVFPRLPEGFRHRCIHLRPWSLRCDELIGLLQQLFNRALFALLVHDYLFV